MTGISAPYEEPENPDITVTDENSAEEAAELIYEKIKNKLSL